MTKINIILFASLLFCTLDGRGQGFVNLNFENADVSVIRRRVLYQQPTPFQAG